MKKTLRKRKRINPAVASTQSRSIIHNPHIMQKSNSISILLSLKNISQNILTSSRINIRQFLGSFRILYKCVFSYRISQTALYDISWVSFFCVFLLSFSVSSLAISSVHCCELCRHFLQLCTHSKPNRLGCHATFLVWRLQNDVSDRRLWESAVEQLIVSSKFGQHWQVVKNKQVKKTDWRRNISSPRTNTCQFLGSFRILYKCVFCYRNFSKCSSWH